MGLSADGEGCRSETQPAFCLHAWRSPFCQVDAIGKKGVVDLTAINGY
jgi:hypothetical protein